MMRLDAIDHKILRYLQIDGRMTNLQLAEKVNLSPTACQNRVRKLEGEGVIKGYRAVISPNALGYNIECLILLRLASNAKESGRALRDAINKMNTVTACYMTSGRIDYIVRVVARDFQHYESIYLNELSKLPNLESTETLFLIGEDRSGSPIFTDAQGA